MRALAFAAAVLAGCASNQSPPPGEAPDRVPELSLLRAGQPYLAGALEVTRYETRKENIGRHVSVSVANRTGRALRLRWRFRYVGTDGWEARSRDSAAWKSAVLLPESEWTHDGIAEVAEASAVGMDWRYEE